MLGFIQVKNGEIFLIINDSKAVLHLEEIMKMMYGLNWWKEKYISSIQD